MKQALLPALLAASAWLVSTPAAAVDSDRSFFQNATGACQSALPAYEGLVRKRPLTLQNEGSGAAFISCSLMGTTKGTYDIRSIRDVSVAFVNNRSSGDVTVSCTLVSGIANFGEGYVTKSVTLIAGALDVVTWDVSDNGGLGFEYAGNVSCMLPPGAGIAYTLSNYGVDVGE